MERRRGSTQNLVSRLLTNSNTSKPAHKQVKTQARLQNDTAHVRQVAGHGGLESMVSRRKGSTTMLMAADAHKSLIDKASGRHAGPGIAEDASEFEGTGSQTSEEDYSREELSSLFDIVEGTASET